MRGLLADGAHVERIVDFGAHLVFDGVAAYTLLLNATAAKNRSVSLVRVPDTPNPMALAAAEDPASLFQARVPQQRFGRGVWSLALPAEAALLERLRSGHPTIGDLASRVFQGVVTGADGIFRGEDAGPHPADARLRLVRPLVAPGQVVELERALLRPVLAGRSDIRRFETASPHQWVLLPYVKATPTERYSLIASERLRREHPAAWRWLSSQRPRLETRSGRWTDETWFGWSRRQNLELFEEPKVLVPYMTDELCAHHDQAGHFLVNVSTGGYGVSFAPDADVTSCYVAAVLTSGVLGGIVRLQSRRAFRGDWMGVRGSVIESLPLVVPSPAVQAAVVRRYDAAVAATARVRDAGDDHARDLAARLRDAEVTDLDALVGEVYGLSTAELRLLGL